jgi:hypothetical protein
VVVHRGNLPTWALLLMVAFLFYNALNGMATGKAILFSRTVRRSEDGYLYWWAVVVSGMLGIAGIVLVILRACRSI